MTGTLYGVGLGPGDPELVTVKAARLITAADVIRAIEVYFQGGVVSYLEPARKWAAGATALAM